MSSEKPNFLSQPVVKNIFMFRNGDPYYEARRIVINQKRVCNFETLLREVTGGIQAPFGAVRNIYTPRGGHKVDCLDNLQSGEQYVAAGRERFKKLDYLQIGSRKKRLLQSLPMQVKPLPQNRIIVSARFLKPIKEPCPIFVVANGDVLNPAMRLLIHQRMLGQFERILEMITEKMGLRVLGGVRSLFTYDGQHITDGNLLESGQLYVAVGREKFKKLPYSDLLFTKPRGMRRVNGMKAYSLPPIYRLSKQNGNGKSMVHSTDSTDGDAKTSPLAHNGNGNSKEHLSSIVREISQARLLSLRKRRSGQNMSLGVSDNDDVDSKTGDGNSEDKNQPAEEKCAADATEAKDEPGEKAGDEEEDASEKNTEEKPSTSNEEKKDNEGIDNETEGAQEQKENEEPSLEKEGEATAESELVNGEEEDVVKEEVKEESIKEGKSKEQESSSSSTDKTQDSNEKEAESAKGEKDDQDKNGDEVEDKDSGKGEKSSQDLANDVDTGEEQKEKENSNDPDKPQSDNDTKDNNDGRSSRSNVNQEGDGAETKEGTAKKSEEKEVNGEVNGEVNEEDDEVKSEAELDTEQKDSSAEKRKKDRDENGENQGKNTEGKV